MSLIPPAYMIDQITSRANKDIRAINALAAPLTAQLNAIALSARTVAAREQAMRAVPMSGFYVLEKAIEARLKAVAAAMA